MDEVEDADGDTEKDGDRHAIPCFARSARVKGRPGVEAVLSATREQNFAAVRSSPHAAMLPRAELHAWHFSYVYILNKWLCLNRKRTTLLSGLDHKPPLRARPGPAE